MDKLYVLDMENILCTYALLTLSAIEYRSVFCQSFH